MPQESVSSRKKARRVLIDASRIGDGGTIFVQSATVPQPCGAECSGAKRAAPDSTL